MAEKFFWADEIADRIIKEKNKKEYICASGITPSGTVHIGNFREVITTDLVVRALRDKGKKVRFIYSWDDFDRFRKVPIGINKNYEKYIGMPISDFPSPFDKKKSYAKYFEKQFEKSLKKVLVKPEFIQQNIMNKKCKYVGLIKIALDKNASGIIIGHNHPSGSVNPSESDIKITAKLHGGCKLLEISFLDHIIFTESNFYSFSDEGAI